MNYAYLLLALVVAGCASSGPAPVVERIPGGEAAPAARPAVAVPVGGEGKALYTVKRGDTLYSIALEHGQDYRDVAAWNNLDNPNRIQVGRQLRVAPAESESPVAVVKPIVTSAPVEAKAVGAVGLTTANSETLKREPRGGKLPWSEQALAGLRQPLPAVAAVVERPVEKPVEKPAPAEAAVGDDAVDWAWPAAGKTLAGFSDSGAAANKGIDIAGAAGEPVTAAAAGKVVYVGGGLRGYGNLVIVRHNASYLSAYGHNSKVLVKEGQAVTRGQKIAEIGNSDADQFKLHFEIRRQGKPVDPLKYLPAR